MYPVSRFIRVPRAARAGVAATLAVLTILAALIATGSARSASRAAAPPETPRRPVSAVYHSQTVTEDYRWLENASDPEVQAWSDAQNEGARAYLDALPARDAMLARFEEVTRPVSPTYYALTYRAGLYFALMDLPPQQQPMLVCFRSPDRLDERRVIVDPNALDPSGGTTIDFFEPSLDGHRVAVSLSEGGSELGSVSVFDVASGERLPDLVPGVNGGTAGGSVAWASDGKGFLRTRYPQPGERAPEDLAFYESVHFHEIGRPAESDAYVFGRDLPKIAEIFLETTDDGRYVVADVLNGDGGEHGFWLRAPGGEFRPVTEFGDGIVRARFGGEHLYLLERHHSPNGQILRVPLAAPDLRRAAVIVPAAETAITDFTPTASRLYVTYVDGGPSRVRIFDLLGHAQGELPLPELVSAGPVLRTEGDVVLVHHAGYTTPSRWSRFDPATGALEPTPLVKRTPADFSAIEVAREYAMSADGTRVPLSILMRRGTPRDGSAACRLNGYGGFGISMSPSFDERRIVWLEQGGILAIANLRGGGEYGESWHRAGKLAQKQNVFDDFAACARHLIDRGYTSAERLAIEGGSNGGLLMGAALTQHPELCRAVVSHAGIYDMLRNELTPNGSFNTTEYGSAQDPDLFGALFNYSPYHQVRDGARYPAVLFLTGANDPRVDPYHSRKMTARLQAATRSGLPVLLRTSAATGHGSGTPYSEENEQAADVSAFLFDQLGMTYRPVAVGE